MAMIETKDGTTFITTTGALDSRLCLAMAGP